MSSSLAHLGQFPVDRVTDWLSQGKIVPFLGAGASRSSTGTMHMPDGRELADELVSLMPGTALSSPRDNLAKVTQMYEKFVFDRPDLYEHLHKRLEVDQVHTPPGAAARLLAGISTGSQPFFLVTTNYDTFIERAFHDAKRPLCVITQNMRDPKNGMSKVNLINPDGTAAQEDSIDFHWKDYDPGTAFLFKMHGSVHRADPKGPDDIIITEDDYVDFMVSAGGSLSIHFPPSSLTKAYKERRFLFLGYSLYDWNFRAFLRMLVLRNALSGREEKRHYAIQLDPDEIEALLWRQRNVSIYDGDIADFCALITSSIASRK